MMIVGIAIAVFIVWAVWELATWYRQLGHSRLTRRDACIGRDQHGPERRARLAQAQAPAAPGLTRDRQALDAASRLGRRP